MSDLGPYRLPRGPGDDSLQEGFAAAADMIGKLLTAWEEEVARADAAEARVRSAERERDAFTTESRRHGGGAIVAEHFARVVNERNEALARADAAEQEAATNKRDMLEAANDQAQARSDWMDESARAERAEVREVVLRAALVEALPQRCDGSGGYVVPHYTMDGEDAGSESVQCEGCCACHPALASDGSAAADKGGRDGSEVVRRRPA